MARALTIPFAVDALPPALRSKAVDLLLSGKSTRDVSQYLSQHGHVVSHSAVARYKRLSLKPALVTGAKLNQMQGLQQTSIEQAHETARLTNEVLAAEPIVSRIAAKYARYDTIIPQTIANKDFAAFSSVDKAETATMRFDAEMRGLLQQQGPSTIVQVVVNGNLAESQEKPLSCGPDTDLTAGVTDLTNQIIDIRPIRD